VNGEGNLFQRLKCTKAMAEKLRRNPSAKKFSELQNGVNNKTNSIFFAPGDLQLKSPSEYLQYAQKFNPSKIKSSE
jgi:hypothetical protein